MLKIGDVIEVTAERMAYGGEAVARHEGLAVFIPFAAPGDRLRARITERKKNFARASIEEIIVPSPLRRAPICQYFGECGGCQLQHMTYEAQLDAKVSFIRDALRRVGRIDWPQPIATRSASEFGYRTRARVKIARAERDAGNHSRAIGFNCAASHEVLDVAGCPILTPELDRALHTLRASINEGANTESRIADLSEVEIASGERGVASAPEIAGISSATLQRTIRGAVYRYDAATFFQVNGLLLNELVDEAVNDYSGRLAIDLYAGVGLFTIQLGRRFEQVLGVESDARAAKFARQNIRANNLSNIAFHKNRAESWLRDFLARRGAQSAPVDLVLLDPPRAGAAEAVPFIASLKPSLISYVSCDPTTLARDLRKLMDSGYELARVTAIDLFPQTYHVETVAALRRS
ncbi:MAG TPA: class I SAM-dependent RNA methyltransferase [Blastocatellia bacterium]|nr:class I SAM-dependent RNA methyltransferase [Blastocatellia bacterium]